MKISLKPYTGNFYFANSVEKFEALHKKIYKTENNINIDCKGRFVYGEGSDGYWAYLIYASTKETLAHELCHLCFHVFKRCGINPTKSGGEAFCYFLEHLMDECGKSLQ